MFFRPGDMCAVFSVLFFILPISHINEHPDNLRVKLKVEMVVCTGSIIKYTSLLFRNACYLQTFLDGLGGLNLMFFVL